jgi:hypothetical protein
LPPPPIGSLPQTSQEIDKSNIENQRIQQLKERSVSVIPVVHRKISISLKQVERLNPKFL